MIKFIIASFFMYLCLLGHSQPISKRSNGTSTVEDPRIIHPLNLYIPRYIDTTQANLTSPNNIGIDTCGAIIYTYTDNKLWMRACSPKRWIEKGGGAITGGANGVTNNASILELGSSTQNASTFSTDRYINTQGFELYLKSRTSYVMFGADSLVAGGAGYIDIRGPYGGAINLKSDTSARTTNAIQWEKQGVLQAVVGNDIGPTTHHFFIDIYGSTNSVNLEAGGVAFAQFGTAAQYLALRANSRLNIGPTGTIGGQTANVIGSLSASDSVLFTRKIVSSSTSDSVWVSGTDGLLKHRAQSDIASLNIYNSNGTLSADRTVDILTHSLDFVGANTEIFMDESNSRLMLSSSNSIQLIATGFVGMSNPATSNDTSTRKMLVFNTSTNHIEKSNWGNSSQTLQQTLTKGSTLTSAGTNNININNGILTLSNGVISLQGGTSIFMDAQDLELTNLQNDATQNRLLGQISTTGKVGYVTLGSNLTMSSGVLSATGGGTSNFTFPDSLKVIDAYEYGVVFDGTTDNITALRNMRNKAAQTGWPLRFGPGTAYASDSVTFNEMVLIGNGTTIKTTNTSLTIFNIKDSCDVQGFTFIGSGKGSSIPVGVFTLQNGIRVFGSGNAIHNCVFTSLNGSGITLWNGSQIRSNNIYGCRFNTNTIGVYAMSNNEYTSVDNNFFEDNYVGGYERSSSNCMWKNNTFEFDDNAGFRVRGDGADHGKFINNTVNHGGTYGIYFENNAISYLVNDNYIYSSNIAIGLDDTCHNVQFSHNVIANSTISGTKNVRVKFFDNIFISPITVTTTGVLYYNNNPGSDPTLAANDSLIFSQSSGYYRFTNMTSTIDTTTYKWVGMDINGKIARGNSWGNLKIPLVVGSTVISSGSNPNILYNNAGVLGEYTVTGTGTVAVLATSPTITTSATIPLVIGGTGTTSDLILQTTSGVGATGAEFIVKGGNNGATTFLTISNAGEWGIGTAPASGFKQFVVTTGNNASTTAQLWRNSSTQNIFQLNDLGSTWLGNQSTGISQLNVYGTSYFGNPSGGAITPSAKIHIAAGATGASTAPFKLTTGPVNTTAEIGAVEYTTPQLFFTNGGAQRQEIPQIQQSRVSTQYDNTTTTLGNVTGLTATVVAGKIYRFEARLYTTSDVAGGVKVAIGGTATATSIIYEGLVTNAGLTTQGRTTTIGTAIAGVTAITAGYVTITGLIVVNAAGTLTVQAAQNANVGTTSVLTGSQFVLTEML